MHYDITEDGGDVEIRIQDADDHAPQVLAALQECQHGRCGCPTDQYDRLEGMTVANHLDELTIRLHPRHGQRFDTHQLETCLNYTLIEAQHA